MQTAKCARATRCDANAFSSFDEFRDSAERIRGDEFVGIAAPLKCWSRCKKRNAALFVNPRNCIIVPPAIFHGSRLSYLARKIRFLFMHRTEFEGKQNEQRERNISFLNIKQNIYKNSMYMCVYI